MHAAGRVPIGQSIKLYGSNSHIIVQTLTTTSLRKACKVFPRKNLYGSDQVS
jgi:hypothetical protein